MNQACFGVPGPDVLAAGGDHQGFAQATQQQALPELFLRRGDDILQSHRPHSADVQLGRQLVILLGRDLALQLAQIVVELAGDLQAILYRLALLARISGTFLQMADFSKIAA